MIIRPFHLQVSEMTRWAVLGSDDAALLRGPHLRPRSPWRGGRAGGRVGGPQRAKKKWLECQSSEEKVAQAGQGESEKEK